MGVPGRKGEEDGARTVRALRCGCGRRLEGGDDVELSGRVATPLRGAHPAAALDDEQVLALVAHAFELERAASHPGGDVPADEGSDA